MNQKRYSLPSLTLALLCAGWLTFQAVEVARDVMPEGHVFITAADGAEVRIVDGEAYISGTAGMTRIPWGLVPVQGIATLAFFSFAIHGTKGLLERPA